MRLSKKANKKQRYSKPTITAKKIKLNFFYTNNDRLGDSINNILSMNLLAQSPGGCACGSKGIERPV